MTLGRPACAALSALPPGGGALHAAHADGARGGLRAAARAARLAGPSEPPQSEQSPSSWRRRRRAGGPARPLLSVTAGSSQPEETEEAGARLARRLRPGDVVTVAGELGSGKTTFVRGACRALGVDAAGDEPDVHDRQPLRGARCRLPSRSLPVRGRSVAADWAGLEPYFDDAVVFVEWPEAGARRLPTPRARRSASRTRVGTAARSSCTLLELTRRGPRPRVRHRHARRRRSRSCVTARRCSASARLARPHAACCWTRDELLADGDIDSLLGGLVVGTGPGSFTGIAALGSPLARGFALALRRAGGRRINARRAGCGRTRLDARDRRGAARGLHDSSTASRARCQRPELDVERHDVRRRRSAAVSRRRSRSRRRRPAGRRSACTFPRPAPRGHCRAISAPPMRSWRRYTSGSPTRRSPLR